MNEKLLNNLLNKAPEQYTEEDIDTLLYLFKEKFGFTSGVVLDPKLLIDDIEIEGITPLEPIGEDADVQQWLAQDDVKHFDPSITSNTTPNDLEFMCSIPNDCSSHKKYSFACRCIRNNFSSPSEFADWRDQQITELGKTLQAMLPEENS